jgi:hypothetical protein
VIAMTKFLLPLAATVILMSVASAVAQPKTVLDITFTPKEASEAAQPSDADPVVTPDTPGPETLDTLRHDRTRPSGIAQAPRR